MQPIGTMVGRHAAARFGLALVSEPKNKLAASMPRLFTGHTPTEPHLPGIHQTNLLPESGPGMAEAEGPLLHIMQVRGDPQTPGDFKNFALWHISMLDGACPHTAKLQAERLPGFLLHSPPLLCAFTR